MTVYSSTFMRATIFVIMFMVVISAGCNLVKKEDRTAVLLKTESTTQPELVKEVNRFARVTSLHAKIDLTFEDNSFAVFGSKEVYRQAPGEITVQRPAKILLKVQLPAIHTDVA